MKRKNRLLLTIILSLLTTGCAQSDLGTLESLNSARNIIADNSLRVHSVLFKAENSAGQLTGDKQASNYNGQWILNVHGLSQKNNLRPTILFCKNAECANPESIENLQGYLSPNYYDSQDDSLDGYYSCPPPTIGTDSWLEQAINKGICTREDDANRFSRPMHFTFWDNYNVETKFSVLVNNVPAAANSLINAVLPASLNAGVTKDIKAIISSSHTPKRATVAVPFGVNLNALKLYWEISGSALQQAADNTTLVSGSSVLDLSTSPAAGTCETPNSGLTVNVLAADGVSASQAYNLCANPDEPFTKFDFDKTKNNSLTTSLTGTINHTTKTVSFEVGPTTDLSALVPTIAETTGVFLISPPESAVVNLSSVGSYTFTSYSGDTVTYTIQVSQTGAPAVSSFSPAAGATHSVNNRDISVTFNQPMETTSLTNGSFFIVQGNDCNSTPLSAASGPTASNSNQTFTNSYASDFATSTVYTTCLTGSVFNPNGQSIAAVSQASWTTSGAAQGSLTDLIITEWGDAGSNVDYIEVKNFGSLPVTITDSNLTVYYNSTDVTLTHYIDSNETDIANKAALASGISIGAGEYFLIVDSDINISHIATIRGYDSFTGKLLLSNQSTLLGTDGIGDRLHQGQAYLKDDNANSWSRTPTSSDWGTANVGTSTYSCLKTSFNLGDDSSLASFWGNGTATNYRSAGVSNANASGCN